MLLQKLILERKVQMEWFPSASKIICKVYIWYFLGSSNDPQQRNEGEKKMNQTYRQDSQDSKVWIENC